MVDTNFALRATVPTRASVARKLWVIFAYGAATERAEQLELDLDALASEQAQKGGVIHASDGAIIAAQNAVAKFEELLPIGTPSDWVLAGSQAAWDEYERKALELGPKLGGKIDAKTAAKLLRRYQSICVASPRPSYARDVPQLTPDPDDDLLIYDAIRTGVDIFISDDRHVVPKAAGGCQEYELEDKRLQAMRSNYFIDNYCGLIDWDRIDETWV